MVLQIGIDLLTTMPQTQRRSCLAADLQPPKSEDLDEQDLLT